ncbi:MAG: 23S rRNA (guanosine(2251)-2'-O)-methyltransferase RlmB [Actinomycetes bacterium]
MAGNSQRRGAKVKPGTKKGPQVGSGGQRKQKLQGKGPTPKAAERTGHSAKRRADSAARAEAAGAVAAAPSRGPAAKSSGPTAGKRAPRVGPRRPAAGENEVVAGRNPVLEALTVGVPAVALHVQRSLDPDPRVKDSMSLALQTGIAVRECSRDELDKLTEGVLHQGLALTILPYEYQEFDDLLKVGTMSRPGLLIALDGVTDPRNLGAIARCAAAFDGTGLVVPARRSAHVTATAWRASAGALARVPVAQVTNLTRSIEAAKKAGFMVVGLAGDSRTAIGEVRVDDDPVLLVVGAEGKGLSRLVSEHCDVLASIPMSRNVESLNVAVATGIALYSVVAARNAVHPA